MNAHPDSGGPLPPEGHLVAMWKSWRRTRLTAHTATALAAVQGAAATICVTAGKVAGAAAFAALATICAYIAWRCHVWAREDARDIIDYAKRRTETAKRLLREYRT